MRTLALIVRSALASRLSLALSLSLATLSLASCGSSKTSAKDPATSPASSSETSSSDPAPSTSASASAPSEAAHEMPTTCKGDPCTPPNDFVDRLCDRNYAEAALYMFQKDTPWTRAWLRGKVEAWNASGGASMRAVLAFDEEVLVLRFRSAAKGGMSVSGAAGSYDVLRIDGTCFTLDPDNITTKRPPNPRYGPILFHRLGTQMKDTMIANEKVRLAYVKRMKECQGATSGEVSLACVKADEALMAAAAAYIVSGSAVPKPEKIP